MDWRDVKEFFNDTFKYIILFIVILILVIYVFSFLQVIGPSMEPTLNEGNVVLISKAHYHWFKVKRGEIISFEYKDTKYLIKRVIGIPGDKIEYKDNKLYINDQQMNEKYLDNVTTEDFSTIDFGYEVIPDDKYFVLGDNRADSLDSRQFGLIDKKDIIGKIVFNIWPLNKIKIY